MKKFKKLLVALTALALVLVPVLSVPVEVQAEEATTYYVSYVPELNEWRFQYGTWADGGYTRELYYLEKDIKDGDHIVIDGTGSVTINANANIASLTVMSTDGAVVNVKSIAEFHNLFDSVTAINGNVTNAHLYDDSVTNINGNVSYLEVVQQKGNTLEASVVVTGTVGHVKAFGQDYTQFELYNFVAGSFSMTDGGLDTDASKYSKTPVAVTPSAPSDEYDKVPKMGDVEPTPFPLFGIGIVTLCIAGLGLVAFTVKRK